VEKEKVPSSLQSKNGFSLSPGSGVGVHVTGRRPFLLEERERATEKDLWAGKRLVWHLLRKERGCGPSRENLNSINPCL